MAVECKRANVKERSKKKIGRKEYTGIVLQKNFLKGISTANHLKYRLLLGDLIVPSF